jgi:hypothetical protein
MSKIISQAYKLVTLTITNKLFVTLSVTDMPQYGNIASYQWCTQNFFFWGGGSTNLVEDRENRDLGTVAPYAGVLEAAVIWYKKFHFIW